MRHIIFLILLTVFTNQAFSQFKTYDWEEERQIYDISGENQLKPAIFLKNFIRYDYEYENENLVQYLTEHKIVKVNNDDAIQSFNKIYISMYNVIDIVELKARSISKEGKKVVLDKLNIKEIKDDSQDKGYKIFAVEGVEKESEIEYFYTLKMHPSYSGNEFFQFSVPLNNVTFELSSPSNLEFKFKSYNGFPEINDTLLGDKNLYYVSSSNIESLEEEEYSVYNPNRQRVEFKLAYNRNHGEKELFGWQNVAENIYNGTYTFSKKEEKNLEKLIKQLKIHSENNDSEKIKKIENHVKTNFIIQQTGGQDLSQIDFILDNHYGDRFGMVRLYAGLFKKAGIKHQVVLTSDRSKVRFDKDFESYRFLNNYLIYFDDTEKFLAPENPEYRYPMIPFNFTHTYGLFLKAVKIGSFESFLHEVKFIPVTDFRENFNNLEIKVQFSSEMDKLEVDIKKSLGGYDAVGIQPYFKFMEEEQKQQFLENLMKSYSNDAEFTKMEVENEDPSISPVEKPFIINTSFTTSALFEKAGNKYLLKIGEIIGPQVEMYQEKERKLPVENSYNRLYDRVIKFTIPEGYRIKNPDDINIDFYHEKNGERIFNFTSNYTIEGQVLSVKILEYYSEIECSVEFFEEYRKVINAAADFNKIILVLEPVE